MAYIDINQFEKGKFLDNGSFGEVFMVKQKETHQIYAAKISKNTLDENSRELLINLSREVNNNAKMVHPAVMKFIGYSPIDFNKEKKPVIITEYLKNGSLYKIIDLERRSLSPPRWNDTQKLITIYGIVSGMSYLHSHNILHRDLKPQNILMDEYLLPKIADFGYSKQIHQNQETMTLQSTIATKGTPMYISPEILNDKIYSKASDVYAFGIILYEIITNERPFKNLDQFKIYNEVVNGKRPNFNYPIEPVYRDLIERCWAQDAKDRPTFDSILDELKNNHNFVTENVDQDDFFEYVHYIEDSKFEFISDKKIINIDGLVSKKKSRIFQKIDMNKYYENAKMFVKSFVFGWFSRQEKLFSLEEFNSFNEDCKNLIDEAETDPSKQFLLGKYLIEGDQNFPKNCKAGIKYLERSISSEFIDSAIYLCNHLYKGDLIPQDLNKAEKYLKKIVSKNDERVYILLNKILKKLNKPKEARLLLEQNAKNCNCKVMYEYAKTLFLEEGEKSDIKMGLAFFNSSKNAGFLKSEQYLNSFQVMNKNKSFQRLKQKTKHFIIKQIMENIEKKEIYMKFKQVSILFENDSFISDFFIDVLFEFKSISFEIYYPSKIFDNVFKQIIHLKEYFLPQIKIIININDIQKIEINGNKFIDCVNFLVPNIKNITKRLFNKCSSLSQITIPSSVTVIEQFAFKRCSSLKKVSFTDDSSLVEIHRYAFKYCVNLNEIEIPSTVNLIEEGAFLGCSLLLQIKIPKSLSVINSLVFYECSSLTSIEIPSSITIISEKAFKKCSSLKQVIFEQFSSLTRIKNAAFKKCTSLTKIEIPSSVRKIEGKTFCGCLSLIEISIPQFVTYIGYSSFKDCRLLHEISIPSSVISIEENLFNGCTSLKKITIPESVTNIGYYSFCNCSSLNEISIPTNVKSIGEGAFYGCSLLEEIIIPPSIKEIRKKVFQNCFSLKRVSMPSSVSSIGEDSFKNCSSLVHLSIPPNIKDEDLLLIGFDIHFIL